MIVSVDPPKVPMRCKLFGHRPNWWYFNISRAMSSRSGSCERCGLPLFQHTGARKDVKVEWSPPCTHGSDGQPTMCCMVCAVDRQRRGVST